jgi:NADH-quinone oxidoreductase subunit D
MIKTETISVNLGPQHPSTHGVYRCILTLEGEFVIKCENVVGYLHRGVEKIGETRTYNQFIPYTDRLDYLAAMVNEYVYVKTVEKLMNIEVPERAKYMRIIIVELQRIASHMVYVASMALDLAAFTGWMYLFRDREKIMDLFELVNGTRLTHNYLRFGGVAHDFPEAFYPALRDFLGDFKNSLKEYNDLITGNDIFIARTKGIGYLAKEQAIDFGITGPNLRASGINIDARRDDPDSDYLGLDFDIPCLGEGDTLTRFILRILEMAESAKIIEQALEKLPEGNIMSKVPKILKPPAGEIYYDFEAAKGLLGYHIVSDGTAKPFRIHVHSPSLVNLWVFPELCIGTTIQDTIAILASIDIVLGEVDR